MTDTVPENAVAQLRREHSTEFVTAPFLATAYYGLNLTAGPCKTSLPLRQALSMAIDWTRLVQSLSFDQEDCRTLGICRKYPLLKGNGKAIAACSRSTAVHCYVYRTNGYFFDEDLRAARLAFLGCVGWLGVARPVSSCTARSSKGESSLPRMRERTNTNGPRCHARRSSSTSRP
jgi:hypothetical protein